MSQVAEGVPQRRRRPVLVLAGVVVVVLAFLGVGIWRHAVAAEHGRPGAASAGKPAATNQVTPRWSAEDAAVRERWLRGQQETRDDWETAKQCMKTLSRESSAEEYRKQMSTFCAIAPLSMFDRRWDEWKVLPWLESLDRDKVSESVVAIINGDEWEQYTAAARIAEWLEIQGAAKPIIELLTQRLAGPVDGGRLNSNWLQLCLGRLAARGNREAKQFLLRAASIAYWEKNARFWSPTHDRLPPPERAHEAAISLFMLTADALRNAPSPEASAALTFPEGSEENTRGYADFNRLQIRNFLISGDSLATYEAEMAKSETENKYASFKAYQRQRDSRAKKRQVVPSRTSTPPAVPR